MKFPFVLPNRIVIQETRPRHAAPLAELQEIVFPTLAPAERFQPEHYLRHLDLFPEGQFCALDGDRVVGMTSTVRQSIDFDHAAKHTFEEVVQGGWLTSHQPKGEWLYGADIGVHPQYRRRGIARALYAARHARVHQLGLFGQVTVGMMSGYGSVRHELAAESYYEQICSGQRTDPTVTAQMHIGFEPRALIANYLHDPVCDNYGVLLVLPRERTIHAPS